MPVESGSLLGVLLFRISCAYALSRVGSSRLCFFFRRRVTDASPLTTRLHTQLELLLWHCEVFTRILC